MTDAPAEGTPAPLRLPSPRVWLKSEYLNLYSEQRFEPGPHDFEGASWQLRKFALWRHFDPPFDYVFDRNVWNAWFLPWYFSGTQLEVCHRRGDANFVIRHVGFWDGDDARYGAVTSALNRPLRSKSGGSARKVFALTPFSIIAQHVHDGVNPQDGGEIVHTEILFFYTFETFVQEALARSAYIGGAAPNTIVGAYEHVHANTEPELALLRDPAELQLAALVASDFSWKGIRNHVLPQCLATRMIGTAEDSPIDLRESLFQCRLQSHLMVAIAAACHGLASFQRPTYASPLVAPLPSIPTIGDLAPFWLRHLSGEYDYADACMRLLESLARCNGVQVEMTFGGDVFQNTRSIRTEIDEGVLYSKPALGGGRGDLVRGTDSFRWGIFDTAIDDDALVTWYRDLRNRLMPR
jgi:hypothetical protein